MEMLLAGEHPTLLILRDQFRVAHVINRKLTGVGFLTAFLIPPEAPRLLGSKSLRLDDVTAVIDRLQHGAGFVLFTNHGAIDVLKGFSFDEPWAESIERFQLSYMGSPTRDPSVLSQELQD
jgi:hypothetical protein